MHEKGFVHRDIKLENVILDSDYNIKLIDFGLSENTLIRTGEEIMTTGTTGYISPEQLSNDGSSQFCLLKCDIFAMGVFLFIMVNGVSPFVHPEKDDKYYQYICNKRYS
jgi:serine/threonine protein kinase